MNLDMESNLLHIIVKPKYSVAKSDYVHDHNLDDTFYVPP